MANFTGAGLESGMRKVEGGMGKVEGGIRNAECGWGRRKVEDKKTNIE